MIIDNVESRINGLLKLSDTFVEKNLYSDAAANLRVTLEFIKTKQKVLHNFNLCEYVLNICNYLIWVEDCRCNFGAVVEVYNDLKDNFPFSNLIGKDCFEEGDDMYIKEIQLYYELALVTTNDSNSDTSCICKFLLRLMATRSVDADPIYMNSVRLLEMTQNVLRVAKRFDEAIDLDEKLLLLPNLQKSLEVKVSLVVSYMERYREEYHLRSKRDDYFLVKNLLDRIYDGYHEKNTCELSFEFTLAQWHYLCHKLSDEKHKRLCYEQSICHIEKIVENEWKFKDYCSTCAQAPTKDEVKFVCSGCRVSCYCGIDHQRMHWRKHQICGTCVGHETFCPVLKAYRKWKAAMNESTTDEEKQGKMRRRFERECLDFLGYGLRLEKKCFELEHVRAE